MDNLLALAPVDGRYAGSVEALRPYFSEFALTKYRVTVELRWLVYLCNKVKLERSQPFTTAELEKIHDFIAAFSLDMAEEIKEIEKETNHDVKAVEYFLQKFLKLLKREDTIPFLHFACTSEDINNLSYALMLKESMKEVMEPELMQVLEHLRDLSQEFKDVPMMAKTHGQPASPTTVSKELKNMIARLYTCYEKVQAQEYFGKINGATGNYHAHSIAYPKQDWIKISQEFVESLGLTWQKYTTQIEPHDYVAELSQVWMRINTILIDMNRDFWLYISSHYFKQKKKEGEVGSSTMPHKVNPIDFENSEGNLGLANALLDHFALKLPLSRMQRDLTDSTVQRNLGLAFAYSLLAMKNHRKGLGKLELNREQLEKDLDENWSLLTEAIQTVMRSYGVADAYEQLKNFSRGEALNQEKVQAFIEGLDLPEEAKTRLLDLTPASYLGLATKL